MHWGTLLTYVNGRRIPIAGYLCLDVQIEIESLGDPVVTKGKKSILFATDNGEIYC